MSGKYSPGWRALGTLGAWLAATAAAAAAVAGAAAAPTGADLRLDAYLQGRPARAAGFGPQGAVLIESRFGTTQQLHLVAQEGGARRQLSFGSQPVTWAAFSPDRARNALAFLRGDAAGPDRLYYQPLAAPEPRRIGDDTSAAAWPVWSAAGHELAYTRILPATAAQELVVSDVDAGREAVPRVLVSGAGGEWRALDWAGDDHLLLALQTLTRAEAHLFLIDLASGQRREVEAGVHPAGIRDARLAADGQGVYYLSDGFGEFTQLRYVNLFSGQKSGLTEALGADVTGLALSRDGHYLAYTSRDGIADRPNLVDLIARQDLTPPALPVAGLVTDLAFDDYGQRLLFTLAGPTQPGDAWVLDIGANRVAAWTHSEVGPVDASRFVVPRLERIATFDRDGVRPRTIPTWVYEPLAAGPLANPRHSVLIDFAGGPLAPYRPGYDPWLQYLVNERGTVVLVPCLRGSAGFGRAWRMSGTAALREDALKDIGALLAWVRGQRSLDAQHILVAGTGIGGTLALDALVTYPDRLRGGVTVDAVSDLVEWLSTADATAQPGLRAEFGDEREWQARAALRRLSPLASIERLARPILVAHGSDQREVPGGQSEALIAAARSHNVEVRDLSLDEAGPSPGSDARSAAFLRAFAQFLATQ
jgi:dipeptidyl aminopeptidase/acylaminoacyl peptidase